VESSPLAGPLPWTPTELLALTYLFGPVAGGMAAGINFKRLGKANLLAPSIFLGVVLFGVILVVAAIVPGVWGARAGGALNLLAGLIFLCLHKPIFDGWKLACWASEAHEGDRYEPGRLGELFLVGLGCALLQVAVIAALLFGGLLLS